MAHEEWTGGDKRNLDARARVNDAVQRAIIPMFDESEGPHGHCVREWGWLHVAEAALNALRDLPEEIRREAGL